MIRWLLKIVFGWTFCDHKWTVLEQRSVMGRASNGQTERVGMNVYLQCEKCGDVTRRALT